MIGTTISTIGIIVLALINSTRNQIEEEVNDVLSVPSNIDFHDRSVSIVVPSLNEEKYLEKLFISIQNQDYHPIEIIVGDSSEGDSLNSVIDLCNEYGVKYVYVPKGNVSKARNTAAKLATSSILLFVDADCIITRSYIDKMLYELDNGAVLAHGSDPQYGNDFRSIITSFSSVYLKPFNYTARGMTMRASDFWEIGGFDEECNPADTNYESGMFDESICREDLKLGLDTQDRFGANSVVRVYDALVPTSARRSENSGLFTVDSDENWATPVRRYRER